jgi:2'-5' RNA ligase
VATGPTLAQSALIVSVPEAEPVVGQLRQRLDPAAQQGVPPHITLLFPFAAPDMIGPSTVAAIKAAISPFGSFSFQLPNTARFPGTLYPQPLPSAPFVAPTQALAAAFSDFPPYGGAFSDIIPHLTVAHGTSLELDSAHAELISALAALGPPRSTCRAVDLIENSSGRWRPVQKIQLGQP